MRRLPALLLLAAASCSSPLAPITPAAPVARAVPRSASSATKESAPAKPTCAIGTVRVEGGAFVESEHGRAVRVGALCVGAHEVTVDEYARCVAAKACAPAFDTASWPLADEASIEVASARCNARREGHGAHPVNCVDWTQSSAYCAFAGMRLPTDDEWEWLARGGARGAPYPWGDEAPTSERVCAGRDDTCPTGALGADAITGLLGNVWEWTSTSADVRGELRSFRGGGFSTPLDQLGHWPRSAFPASARTEVIGVRCVRDAP